MATGSRFSREMGLTHAEFFRDLPAAIGHRECQVEAGPRVCIPIGRGRLRIELGPPQVRAIAALRLPFSQVTFEFAGVDEVERERFMQRFDLYMRRGGG